MATPFDDWLSACRAAVRGGPDVVWHGTRGEAFPGALIIAGDWTGAVVEAVLKMMPDAAASLVTFSVGAPSLVTIDGAIFTRFPVTLASGTAANSTGILPAAPAATPGVFECALIIWMTPSGGSRDLFIGGRFQLLGD